MTRGDAASVLPLIRLSRCPLCRQAPAGPAGCCPQCQAQLFCPQREAKLLTLGEYRGQLKRAIHAYKYRHVTRLAQLFAAALAAELKRAGWPLELICPVPLHWSRYLQRGYNQAALLARLVARELELPYAHPLRRIRRTRQQAKLSREARLANVQSAFSSRPVSGQLLLVDDVITSGATGEACRQALKRAGAREVWLAAIARAPRTL